MYKQPCMQEETSPRGSINLQLFRIPISIHPISWVMLAILGGGLGISGAGDISRVLLFVVAGMLCLIVHELGHALVGRRLTGCQPSIDIAGLGGMTYTPRLPRTRAGYFMLVFAGPLASFLLGVSGGAVYGLQLGDIGLGIEAALVLPLPVDPSQEFIIRYVTALFGADIPDTLQMFYLQLFGVCLWWTIFNLLPIFPLDGGKLLGTLLNSDRKACMVGLVFGGALCILCLAWVLTGGGSLWNVFIVGYLTYINYSVLRQMH